MKDGAIGVALRQQGAIDQVFDAMDVNGDGVIDRGEFVQGVSTARHSTVLRNLDANVLRNKVTAVEKLQARCGVARRTYQHKSSQLFAQLEDALSIPTTHFD